MSDALSAVLTWMIADLERRGWTICRQCQVRKTGERTYEVSCRDLGFHTFGRIAIQEASE